MTLSIQSLRLLAGVFTRPVFSSMARTGDPHKSLEFLLKGKIAFKSSFAEAPLSSLFEDAWHYLSTSYRNEYIYKNELATRLIFGRHSPRTAGFQVEFPVGRSIADIVIANGTSTAYEIKTEFDTSRRLPSQTSDYLQVFDKVYVVTHPAHVERYERELDPRVGLIVLTQRSSLTPYREAYSNAENVSPTEVFKCLRREEYVGAIQQLLDINPIMPNGLIAAYCEKLFAAFTPQEAHQVLVKALRLRTTNKSTVDFVVQLPSSLRALGYATPLSGKQRVNLLELLSQPTRLALSI